ncbi:MAG: oligosaccharide flippase family protein [Gemmatimonadetes bacterium]|nr:oligosaccharide flippase family protein [Gemmatimonadota bacterium]
MTTDRTFLSGVAWVGGLRLMMQAISWASTLVVVRFIAPADYGIMGMAGAVLLVAGLLAEFGIAGAVLTTADLSEDDAARLNGLAVAVGLAVALLVAAAAPLLGLFFREPRLVPVLWALAATFVLDGVRTVPSAMLQRQLRYKRSAAIESARSLAMTASVLSLAIAGAGYWALVTGAVLGAVVATGLAIALSPVRIAVGFSDRLRTPLRTAKDFLIGRLAWQAYTNGDVILVGRLRSVTDLGQYTLAWNIASLPGEKLTNLLTVVSSSFFASLRHDLPAMRRYLLLLTEGIAVLTWPVLAGIALVAPDAVPLLWGEQWRPAVRPMQLLVSYAALSSLGVPFGQVLAATGQVAQGRRNALFSCSLMLPAFYLAASQSGIVAVAACWLLLYPLIYLRPYLLVRETLSIPVRDYARALVPAASITAVLVGTVLALRLIVTGPMSPRARFALEVTAGALAVGAALGLGYRHRLLQVVATVRAPRT